MLQLYLQQTLKLGVGDFGDRYGHLRPKGPGRVWHWELCYNPGKQFAFSCQARKIPHYRPQPSNSCPQTYSYLTWSHTGSSLVPPDLCHTKVPTATGNWLSAFLLSHEHGCSSFLGGGGPKVENSYPRILGPYNPFPQTGPLATK